MIDSHCHLDDPAIAPDLAAVLARARAAGVDRFVCAGTAHDQWPRLARLAADTPRIHAAYGIHPWFCDRHRADDLRALEARLADAVALGECGLDGTRGPTMDTQRHWLREQLALAARLNLPVVLHCVRAADALLRLLRERPRDWPELCGVVHGFAGSRETMLRLIDAGLHIGIGTRGWLGRGQSPAVSARRLAMLRAIPAERLLLETDAPFGGPDPRTMNEPARLPRLAARLAALRGEDASAIIAAADANARRLFGIGDNDGGQACTISTNARAS